MTNINYIEVYISIRDRTEYISSTEEEGNRRCSRVSRLAVQQMLGRSSITLPNRVVSLAAQCFCKSPKNWSWSISICGDVLSVESAPKSTKIYY